MKSLEELEEENRKLRAQAEVEKDFEERNEKAKKLRKENFEMKHQKKIKLVRKVGRGAGKVGGTILGGLASGLRHMGETYAENQRRANAPRKKNKTRRVKKVKKKKQTGIPTFNVPYYN